MHGGRRGGRGNAEAGEAGAEAGARAGTDAPEPVFLSFKKPVCCLEERSMEESVVPAPGVAVPGAAVDLLRSYRSCCY